MAPLSSGNATRVSKSGDQCQSSHCQGLLDPASAQSLLQGRSRCSKSDLEAGPQARRLFAALGEFDAPTEHSRPYPHRDRFCKAGICAASCGAFASAGPRRASRLGVTVTRGPKRWRGARRTASITFSGLPGTKPLARKVRETADAIRTERAISGKLVIRGYAETGTRPNPGTASGAPSLASRPPADARAGLFRKYCSLTTINLLA